METPIWEARRNKERGTDPTTQHTTPDKDGTHNFYARLSLFSLPKNPKSALSWFFLYLSSKEEKGQTEGNAEERRDWLNE